MPRVCLLTMRIVPRRVCLPGGGCNALPPTPSANLRVHWPLFIWTPKLAFPWPFFVRPCNVEFEKYCEQNDDLCKYFFYLCLFVFSEVGEDWPVTLGAMPSQPRGSPAYVCQECNIVQYIVQYSTIYFAI